MTDTAKELARQKVVEALIDLERLFTSDMNLSFLARHSSSPTGHWLISADKPDDVIEAMWDLKADLAQQAGQPAPPRPVYFEVMWRIWDDAVDDEASLEIVTATSPEAALEAFKSTRAAHHGLGPDDFDRLYATRLTLELSRPSRRISAPSTPSGRSARRRVRCRWP